MSEAGAAPGRLQGGAPDRIELRGIRVMGSHGVLPEEHSRPQPFEVDLDVELDTRPSARADELGLTVDYAALADAAARVVAGQHVDLLETLADRIATACAAAVDGPARVDSVRVTVRKLQPLVAVELASAGVTVVRRVPDPGTPGVTSVLDMP